jgi:hypothetical protein
MKTPEGSMAGHMGRLSQLSLQPAVCQDGPGGGESGIGRQTTRIGYAHSPVDFPHLLCCNIHTQLMINLR